MQQVQAAMDAFQTTRLGTQRLAIERLNDRLHVLDQLDRAPLLYARLVCESARRLEFLRLHRMVRASQCARTQLTRQHLPAPLLLLINRYHMLSGCS